MMMTKLKITACPQKPMKLIILMEMTRKKHKHRQKESVRNQLIYAPTISGGHVHPSQPAPMITHHAAGVGYSMESVPLKRNADMITLLCANSVFGKRNAETKHANSFM